MYILSYSETGLLKKEGYIPNNMINSNRQAIWAEDTVYTLLAGYLSLYHFSIISRLFLMVNKKRMVV